MFINRERLQHINSIAHEGKIIVFGTNLDGNIYYTVKQDGFEDSYGNTQVTGWEDWQELEFPQEENGDRSVIEKEQEELTYTKNGNTFYFLKSVYETQEQSAVAPVQLISGLGHLYVFRQSKSNTLLVDRFVLDGLENKLVRKLEVRYKRSRQKYQPLEQTNGNKLSLVDSLDFRDIDGNPFYEPTTELSIINHLHNGWFSVVLLPTNEHNHYRWHIFAYNSQTQRVELTSIRASKEGLFDIKDYTILEPQLGDETVLLPRSIPGIIKRTLDIKGVKVRNGLAATKYDMQVERQTQDGEQQLLKEATRVMLVMPTEQGDTAALSFAVAGDGTLAQIDETPETDILRTNDRHVLLPLNTLDEIKAIGKSMPPAQGTITGMERTEADKVKIISPQSENLKYGEIVQISGTNHYNGHYVAKKIDTNTFEIEAKWLESELGNWEVVPKEESGLVFDGIITAFEKTADGKLRVTAPNHGLNHGDEVQITDTQAYNDTYPITEVEGDSFTIGTKWQPGEAINLKLESKKRRGISFDGDRDYISIPSLDLKTPHANISFGETYSAWVYVSERKNQQQLIIGQKDELMQLFIHEDKAVLKVHLTDGFQQIEDNELLPEKEWIHLAGVFSYDKKTKMTTVTLCRNGQEVAQAEFQQLVSPLLPAKSVSDEPNNNGKGRKDPQWTPEFWIGGAGDRKAFFAGKISDVQIWNQPRTAQEIKDSMYLQLTGREVGLVGYWRLGAIMEDKQRHVVDFSMYGNDGTVYGEAFVSAITLNRTLQDGKTPAIKYVNDELFAVSQRATYVESFEFKGIKPNNFEFSYWGKPNRNSQQQIEFAGGTTEFKDLGNGWYLASCRFTVPDEITLVRSFEISRVQGDWKQLEIRKHYIRIVSDSITQDNYTDSVTLKTLDDKNAELEEVLKRLTPLERQEVYLLEEKRDIEADLALLNDPQLEAKLRQLKSNVNRQKKKIQDLETAVPKLRSKYQEELNDKFNYWQRLVVRERESKGESARIYTKPNEHRMLHGLKWGEHSNQKFKFEPIGGGYYTITCQYQNRILELRTSGNYYIYGENDDRKKDTQQWRLEQRGGYYTIRSRWNDRVMTLSQHPGSHSIYGHPTDKGKVNQQWKIIKLNQRANQNIANAYQALVAKQKELKQAKEDLDELEGKLNDLEKILADKASRKQSLEERLQAVTEQLQAVQAELNRLNNEFLKQVQTIQHSPQSMPELATDSRGLVTKGVLLGFVRPISQISAVETSEGNVQLSYFDTNGRMRQTHYDATSDSRNAAFEQWIPDSLRACPNFDKEDSVVLVEDSISLNEEWTIEAWFSYPLPETAQWNTLTRGNKKEHHIIVENGKQLGTYIGGFQDSGYNMEHLSPGWHHITAVGRGDGEQATTTFYIDGRQIGECQAKTTSDVYAIGNDNKGGQQFGKLAEVRIWQVALSEEEIEVNSKTLLSGNEPGLLGYYPMNEAKGTEVRDYSENNRHGKMQSTTWFGCTAAIGHPGHTVMQFDGNGDYIDAGNINLSGQALTISAWVKVYAFEEEYPNISTIAGIEKKSHDNTALLRIGDAGIENNQVQFVLSVGGKPKKLNSKTELQAFTWYHVAATYDGKKMAIFINGKPDNETAVSGSFSAKGIFNLAKSWDGRYLNGCLADVCLWNKARSLSEIQTEMHKRLTGREANLIGYWPLNAINMDQSPYTVSDLTGNHDGTVYEALTTEDNTLPIGYSALISTEYSTISIDPDTQRKSAMMRRFFAMPALDGAIVLPDKRVELLELKWIGNAQFEPTLLGYIEGAPPVPSENLTVLDNYNNATSVELTASEDVAYSWNREQDGGFGATASLFIGTQTNVRVGIIKTIGALSSRQGFIGELSTSYSFLNSSNISASSNLSVSDKLELRGSSEQIPKFPHLGNRFLPKNVGYALVVSGLADVYITRLARSKKMVGYQVQPNKDVPPDVNTITFLMNPAYVMNGSLDGLIGSSAADERFYQHVPQMRTQYGSLYPASYYRLQEAYDLERQIEQQDQERQSYFENFNSRLVDETSLNREIGADASDYDGYGQISLNPEEDNTEEGQEETDAEKIAKIQEILEGDSEKQEKKNEEKQEEIESKIKDQEKRVQASESFTNWQRKLEDWQIRAGKRNIVNTYVWDADGGLRSESQQFANTVEHTIGGSFNLKGSLGGETAGNVLFAAAEFKASGTFHLTQTLTKTERRSKGFALNVELRSGFRGLESTGITDADGRPILPGEKVDRYRLKSFYLEGGVQHFHDFFNYVVDPEWLASNSEEARALRQTKAGKANKTWRVLHRVTYVERPALMGFGRDIRQLPAATTAPNNVQLLAKIQKLEQDNQDLEKKLDRILHLLESN